MSKESVCKGVYSRLKIEPNEVTSSPRNPYFNASIVRLFDNHRDTLLAPAYNEQWIKNVFTCSKIRPELSLAQKVVPTTSHSWLNKSALDRLSKDCILILHFLWNVGAVLLPLNTKKPTEADPDKTNKKPYEFAAQTYPELLAFVSQPFVPHVKYQEIPNILTAIPPTAIENFKRNAWRLVRATSWYQVEDISTDDLVACMQKLLDTRRGKCEWFLYPIAPQALVSYVSKCFPGRCKVDLTSPNIINYLHATRNVIERGDYFIPDAYKKCSAAWLKYQKKHNAKLESRGMKSFAKYEKSYGVLNSFLFEHLPLQTKRPPPYPHEFSREHIDGSDFEGLISYIRKGRSGASCRVILQQLSSLFDYMASNSSLDGDLEGFVNPITTIDFPLVRRSRSTNKAVFSADHFPLLLQFSYAVEAFTWYLAEKVHYEKWNLYSEEYRANFNATNWNQAHKVIQTDKLGFVPVLFYKNTTYDPSLPASPENRRMLCAPINFLPRFIVPLHNRNSINSPGLTSYPQLNYIQHNVVALETGIRTMHIRWFDKNKYDKEIDRSRALDPISKLFVNTDKVNGPWVASVHRTVIEVLDRQKESHSWFDEPAMNDEIWYDGHKESDFGKITPLFPSGRVGSTKTMSVPFSHESYATYFSRLVFTFDLFCRYQLGIPTTNKLPEFFVDIDELSSPEQYCEALKLEKEAVKLCAHTPHSCRATVVSAYIRILPPHIIGDYITGHSTEAHVIYYAKVDPDYLSKHRQYQKLSFENSIPWGENSISQTKAEDINSKLQVAFRKSRDQALNDFGAMSFEGETETGIKTGLQAARQQPLEALAYASTHICPFGNNCPKEIIRDLGAIPGGRTPCGGCYYSIKTVDHLPRIVGHIRAITDECAELESYIADAKKEGASIESLTQKADYRKFLAAEIVAWTVTAQCLDQMYKELKTRSSYLVDKPDIVAEQLGRVVIEGNGLTYLLARIAEAKTHPEYFTPQLKHQVIAARSKLLAHTGRFNQLLQEAPKGYTILDEFRGLIRSICDTLGVSFADLALAYENPHAMKLETPNIIMKLISDVGEPVDE